jgi:hypothetical protein
MIFSFAAQRDIEVHSGCATTRLLTDQLNTAAVIIT